MTLQRAVLAFVLAAPLLAPAGNAGAQSIAPAVPTAAECAARLRAASEADDAQEAPRLADVCAPLAEEIESGAWGSVLGSTGAEELSARPFEELVEVIAHYEEQPGDADLAVAELASVVESLRPFEPVAELSMWERLRNWLRERLGFDDASGGGGLFAWLRTLSIPEQWIRTIVYVLGITVVIAALVVVANELRVNGVFDGGAGPRDRRRSGPAPAWATRAPLTLEGVRRAPPGKQPGLLLRMLVERLHGRYGDAVRASLTHRELAAAAGSLGVRHRDELDAVVSAAERVTFAGWRPGPGDVDAVLSQGEAVLEELEAERDASTRPQ